MIKPKDAFNLRILARNVHVDGWDWTVWTDGHSRWATRSREFEEPITLSRLGASPYHDDYVDWCSRMPEPCSILQAQKIAQEAGLSGLHLNWKWIAVDPEVEGGHCPWCDMAAEFRRCAGCGEEAWIINCGHYDQPPHIVDDLCTECYDEEGPRPRGDG